MSHWFFYTGESFVCGRGRLLSGVITDADTTTRILHKATAHSPSSSFTAALAAALAMQELKQVVTPFTSAGQALRLFKGTDIAQAAINYLNGRISSGYAELGDIETITHRITGDFASEKLLMLPRDEKRLTAPGTLDALPGALAFLLARSHAERKSFAAYLRRGTSPLLTTEALREIFAMRKAHPTFTRPQRRQP